MSDPAPTRFAILLDGALHPTERLRAQVKGRRILAADGGIRNAERLGVTPELWLGDFDSADPTLEDRFSGVARDNHSPDKAVSDGEIAIRHALELGACDLLLVGALGGPRSDHAFFNLAGAVDLARRIPELDILLSSGDEEAIPVRPKKKLRPDWPDGTIFSVMSFDTMVGLTVRGAKWPLDDVHVPFGSTWTLSNVAKEGLEIHLTRGYAVAICQFDKSRQAM
ncbi:thiamine diphosphokinase [Oricola sp.]|uniref:thiamine diphosphokinase n=1 Tax=Oricola sp. TaxID=1979950 RepID=UPI0025EEB24F|nr:thiamine diphosphokinase [Oricola sp.]MCI5075144.1 thiamine diphosphokinase [Oricola sp.]